ncbi:hypothetical protein RN001_009806 [Aquatica leii]|uniref:Ionotropic glutamate receptor C-terminal domain-containing protein n=1 Tax=Aquatica leii TaxID=1421715 RepID=A0AAN7P025_9COLE|nr:hypothetical protein RN001_009806 [Aquatica leii]
MLVLNVICLSLVVALVIKKEEQVEKINFCAQQTIQYIFDKDDTLLFMFDDSHSFTLPGYVTNPSMFINIRKDSIIFNTSIGHKQNYIINSKNHESALSIISMLHNSELWNKNKTPLRKVLLITSISEPNNLSNVFEKLWEIQFINLVILTYNLTDENRYTRLVVGNPQAAPNLCGTIAKSLITYSCNESKMVKFPRILRKHSNCKFRLKYWSPSQLMTNVSKGAAASLYVIKTTAKYLNMTIQWDDLKSPHDMFTMREGWFSMCHKSFSCTSIYYNDNYVWIVPAPKKIPAVETFKLVFKRTVWILILLAFIFTSILWWLLKMYKYPDNQNDLTLCFLEVFSMTILGLTNKIRLFFAFRCILLSYVIYSIHIQAVFTGKLVTLLTIPQYEKQIQTLKELAESNNLIITNNAYFKNNIFTDTTGTYRIIQSNLKKYNQTNVLELLRSNYSSINSSIFINQDLLEQFVNIYKRRYYYFVDNSFTGTLRYVFYGVPSSHFTFTVNEIVKRLVESGLLDQNNKKYVSYDEIKTSINANKKLSTKNIYPIFVFWGFGLILAFLVFIGELLVIMTVTHNCLMHRPGNIGKLRFPLDE